MRSWFVAIAACSGAPAAVTQPAAPAEPTGPELWYEARGASALATMGDEVFWLAPIDGGSDVDTDANGIFTHADGPGRLDSSRLAHVAIGARGLAAGDDALIWGEGSAVHLMSTSPPRPGVIGAYGEPYVIASVADATVAGVAIRRGRIAIAIEAITGAQLVYAELDGPPWHRSAGALHAEPLEGADPIVAAGSDAFAVGTSTTLYQGSDATPVDGGVRALAVDGDDVFVGNTMIYEKPGRGRLVKLGPAGGPVTAMAVDAKYVYWAIGAGDRDPAIYRALRSRPELELVTRIGAANQLVVAGAYLYWLDPAEGAIHRIRRP